LTSQSNLSYSANFNDSICFPFPIYISCISMPSKLSFASHMQYNQSVRKTSTVNPLYGHSFKFKNCHGDFLLLLFISEWLIWNHLDPDFETLPAPFIYHAFQCLPSYPLSHTCNITNLLERHQQLTHFMDSMQTRL
jgi:hypothetical protein